MKKIYCPDRCPYDRCYKFKIVTQCHLELQAETAPSKELLMAEGPPTKGVSGGLMRSGNFDPIYLFLSLGGSYISNLSLLEPFE